MVHKRFPWKRYRDPYTGGRSRDRRGFRVLLLLGALAGLAVATAAPSARISATKFRLHRLPSIRRDQVGILRKIRGGSDPSSSGDGYSDPHQQQYGQEYQPPSQQYQQQEPQQQQQQPLYGYEYPTESELPNPPNDNIPFQQETLQDRIDNWRNYQREHAEEQRSSMSTRDDQGRMKLLSTVGKGSRAITFFILMWRNVHLYEVVDAKYKGNLRFMGVLPLTFLFVANMAGVVASITSSGHSSKKRLKAILNLNKLVEFFLIIWHVSKLIFATSNLVPREIYISNILHSVFFILQCQTVTRFVWDEALLFSPQSAQNHDNDDDDDSEQWPRQQQQQRQPLQSNPNYNQHPYNRY